MMHTGCSDDIMPEDFRKTSSQEVNAIDADIIAVQVYKKSRPGCVRVIGRTVQNTITGPENMDKKLLIFIDSAKGEKGWIYGEPSVVLFRQRKEVKEKEKEKASSQKLLRVEVPERKNVKTG